MGLPAAEFIECPRCAGHGPQHLGLTIPFSEYARTVRDYMSACSPAREPMINERVRLVGRLANYLYAHRNFLRFHPPMSAAVAEKFVELTHIVGDPVLGVAPSARREFGLLADRLVANLELA